MLSIATLSHRCQAACLGLVLSLLAACGGGDTAPALTVPGAAPPPAATVEISGTAATGAPLASASVSARCQNGIAASTTTRTNGTFSMSVVLSAMPCALRVAPAGGGQNLYSLASGTATTVTANITPLTSLAVSLAVQQATAQTLDAWFDAIAQLPAIANALAGHQTTLRAALAAAGYTVPTPFNPITATFTASAGNAYDDLLEAIAAGLRASGKTFAAAQTSFTASAGASVQGPAPAGNPTPTTVVTASGLGATVTATLHAALVDSRSLQFNNDGAGCGAACSFTNGQLLTVVFGSNNTLSIAGKTLSNPYNRILQGTTVPHTPELIWRDGNIEYALSNNASGTFNEINVGDISAPTAQGLPKFIGQIRAVAQIGIVNVTQFAGTYTKGFQYYGPLTGGKAPTWTGLTITSGGAITFTGGSGTGTGPSLTAAQIGSTSDFIGCCGSVLVYANINTTIGDTTVNENDSIRLFTNAAGQLTGLEYNVDNNNYVGVLLGTRAPLPAHSGAAVPTSPQVAGTANAVPYAIPGGVGGAYSFDSQGGFSVTASTGSGDSMQQWVVRADRLGPLSPGNTFTCLVQNNGSSNIDTSIQFTASGNTYRSTAGGRCLITLTNVTTTGSGNTAVVTAFEGSFVAELFRPERNLPPLVINDGVFRWVKPQ